MVSSKKRRESIEESSPNTSRLDESGYQSDSGQHIMAAAAAAKATGGQGPSPETNPEEEEEEEEEEDKKAKNNSSEDSDSESDTSSDSRHSGDDHEAVAGGKEDNASSP